MQEFFTSFFQQLLHTSLLEWIASISGFLCVYLAARQNILNWPISMISVGIYAFLFYHSKLYGDAVLQVYFLGTAIYGWFYWINRKEEKPRAIASFTAKQMSLTAAIIAGLTFALGYYLDNFTPSDVPYIDGFCTAISFVAQFLMTRKVLQNWLLWVFVDICYIPLYIHKDLALTSLLYLAFAIIAWRGYADWKNEYQKAQHANG